MNLPYLCKVCTNFQLSNEEQNQEKGNINKKEHFTSETKQWICRIFVKSVQTSNCQMKNKIQKKEILTQKNILQVELNNEFAVSL